MSVWNTDAACLDTDPDAFFPETRAEADAAIRVCRVCPVLTECRERADRLARHGYLHGVWAGVWHHGRPSRKAADRENRCAVCGRVFLVPALSWARVTCSAQCRAKRRAASDRRSA